MLVTAVAPAGRPPLHRHDAHDAARPHPAGAARGAARRPPRHARAPHAAAPRDPDDRGLVLRRPLRPDPRRPVASGGHARAAAPPHRPADRDLAARRRRRAPRQRRQPPARAPRRAERHDGRARASRTPRTASGPPGDGCTASSSGPPCRTPTAHQAPHFEHHARPARPHRGRRARHGLRRALDGARSRGRRLLPAARASRCVLAEGARATLPLDADFEHGVLAVEGEPVVAGVRGAERRRCCTCRPAAASWRSRARDGSCCSAARPSARTC